MFDFLKILNSFLPFCIKNAEYDGDNLLLSGEKWLFQCASAWRVSCGGKIIFACWDADSIEMVKILSGGEIIKSEWFSDRQKIDPSFLLSDGKRIDVFCSFSCDPWIIRLPDENVYVGDL